MSKGFEGSNRPTSGRWPECQSSMVRGLATLADAELLRAFQQQPEMARYFIALFCRYEAEVAWLVERWVTPDRISQCLNQVWLRLFYQLLDLDAPSQDLQAWILEQTEELLRREPTLRANPAQEAPVSEPTLSPILYCYLMLGLEALPGDLRFLVVLRDKFQWSPAQISAQLKTDGYAISSDEAQRLVEEGRGQLFQLLPTDVRALYLASRP